MCYINKLALPYNRFVIKKINKYKNKSHECCSIQYVVVLLIIILIFIHKIIIIRK